MKPHVFISCVSFCFYFFIIVSGAGYSELDDTHYVVLSPPTNVTALFINSTAITVAWDSPLVYKPHEVNITEVNDTDTSDNSTDVGNSTQSANTTDSNIPWVAVERPTTTAAPTTTASPNTVVCHKYSHYQDFGMEIIKRLGLSIIMTLRDLRMKEEEPVGKMNIVKFEEGCIQMFTVNWKEVGNNSEWQKENVSSRENTLTISNLKPDTNYTITVTAIFRSKPYESQPPFLFSTMPDNNTKECHCDQMGTRYGTSCNLTNVNSFCECQTGYAGRFCDTCAPGFYRTRPHFPCHKCPCDVFSTGNDQTCDFEEGFLKCNKCEVGYTGNLCHICDNGYYRYGRRCAPCRCNGNAAKNSKEMCHPVTGMCFGCMYNTSGFNCERCLDGYVGDAIAKKNCTKTSDLKLVVKGSSFSAQTVGIIVGIICILVLATLGFFLFKRYQANERRRAFWTVEMKRDQDDVDFNSVHNDDAHLGDEPDLSFYGNASNRPSTGKYARLQEDV
ncbi:uncharacterized protein LOC131956300 [Physella acuta]|uniref:uncharacterized protein LOC131956300 n=1 Tax=Physella acuta TaxID=109671 RepID=UPI0027DBD7A2|nr:uncharacterized protein LOC131956300 [Physella acuta]